MHVGLRERLPEHVLVSRIEQEEIGLVARDADGPKEAQGSGRFDGACGKDAGANRRDVEPAAVRLDKECPIHERKLIIRRMVAHRAIPYQGR
jgi:hypothetical protein